MFNKGHAGKIVACVLIAAVFISLSGCFRKAPTGPVSLTFYGLDDSDVFEPMIMKYKEKNANVSIKYKKFNNPAEFENLLVDEIAEGEGPDIFYIHNTWLPRHTKKIVPLASETLTQQKFQETFVNVAADDFIQPDSKDGIKKIYALPLYVDTLALYYNKQDFEQKTPERGKPANTWDVIKEDAPKFLQQGSDGKLEHGEIALGRADNIHLAADILYNLFLQAGVEFYDADFKQVRLAGKGQEMFDYFTSFAVPQNKHYSWGMDSAAVGQDSGEIEAFLSGKVSAILGYSDLYPQIETQAKNVKSRLFSAISVKDIAVMPSPQIATAETDYKVWANYYGLAVSRNCKNAKAAWDFIQYVASNANAKTFHQKTKRPTARRDLIEDQKKEPITDVFVSQLGYAGSYRIFSDQRFANILKDAVQLVNSGQTSTEAFGQVAREMNEILKLEAPEGLYPKPKTVKKK